MPGSLPSIEEYDQQEAIHLSAMEETKRQKHRPPSTKTILCNFPKKIRYPTINGCHHTGTGIYVHTPTKCTCETASNIHEIHGQSYHSTLNIRYPYFKPEGKKKKTKQKRALQLTSSSKLYFYISATAASCTSILQSRQHPDSHPHMSVTVFQLLIIHNHTVVYIPFHIHKASTALIPDCKGTLFLHNDITPLQASIP